MSVVSAEVLLFLFDFDHRALTLNREGVTHAESLIVATPGSNCMNWMLGHILDSRRSVLELLDAEPVWSEADAAPYDTGESAWPDPNTAGARPWDALVADFETSQERIREALARVTPERLAGLHKPGAKRPRGMHLHFLQFHEAYHVGQIGLLRRVVGKPGAI